MAKSSGYAVCVVLALWAAGLGAAAQFGKIAVLFDLLSRQYPGAGSGIGFMVSLVGLIGLVFGTTAGLLVQRVGYRRVVVGAMALGAGISAFQAQLPEFGWMMASRVLEGASHLAIVVAGPVLIAQNTEPRHQGLAMTLWASFFGVSFAITAWAGLPLAAAYGPGALFWAHALFMAAVGGLLFALLPPDPPRPDAARLTAGALIRQHLDIYASAQIAAPAFGFVFYALIYVAVLTLLPPMMPVSSRSLVAAGMPLVSIAVSFGLGVMLLRVMTAVRLVQGGLALAGLCSVGLYVAWGTDAAVVFAFALAGALGLVQGGSFSTIPQLNATGQARAGASGAVAQLGNLGTTLGTPVLAVLVGQFGIAGVLIFCLPLCLAGILVHQWLALRRERQGLAES